MNVPHPTLCQQPRELGTDSSLIGCTDLLAEPGIPRTRAGVRRLAEAARFISDATGQGLRLRRRRRRHLRHRAPAAYAVGPVPFVYSCTFRGGTRRHVPESIRPGGEIPRSPEGPIGRPPARGRAAPRVAVRAGESPRSPEDLASLFAGQRAGRSLRLPSGRGPGAPRSPEAPCSTACRPVGRAVILLSSGRGPSAPRSPEASPCRLPASGPLGTCD